MGRVAGGGEGGRRGRMAGSEGAGPRSEGPQERCSGDWPLVPGPFRRLGVSHNPPVCQGLGEVPGLHHYILWSRPGRIAPGAEGGGLAGQGRSDVRSPVSRVLAPREGETAISLGPTSRPASNDLPGRHGAGRRREPSLFDLSPGGVCPARPVTRPAVRSYRTVSPLPEALQSPAVCFLWHFPWPRGRLPLATTLTRGARTFLPALRRSGRPDSSRRRLA